MSKINLIWLGQIIEVLVKEIDTKFDKPKEKNNKINVFDK